MLYLLPVLILLLPQQNAQAPAAPDVDPAIQAVVQRFFETQQAEDVEGYLALWSANADRPQAEQLRYIFASGDDAFSDVTVLRTMVTGDTARVRVAATRQRTDATAKRPDGKPRVFTTRLQQALALVREADGWKIVREGSPADELAVALIAAEDPDARNALLASEPDLVNSRLAEAISRRADALAQVQRYQAAQDIYERALEVAQVAGDRKLEGRALQNVANARYFQRDLAGALTLYERRLGLEREIANDEGIASALLGIATVQYSQYEYGAALQSYREALEIQEKLGDEVQVSTTLISTGNVLYLQGDYEGAIADYRRAEEIKRRYHDTSGAATALEGLGRVYAAQGDYAAALLAFAGVLDERRARNDAAGQALASQGIGEIHFRLGNTDQARASFDESRQLFESIKDVGGAGRVLQGTAVNELSVGRFPDAEKAYGSSIKLCTAANDAECVARAQVGLAFALAAQQKYSEAITWYQRSIIGFDALNMQDPSARARIGLAEALSGNKEYADALNQAITARRTGVALENDDLLWRALVSQARAERKLGRPIEALGTARAAVLAVERMAAAALDRPGQAVPRDASTAYATMAVLQAETGEARGALTTVETMRTHALRSDLAANERDIVRGMTEAERAEERTLAAELTTLIVRRDREKGLPKPDPARIEKLERAIKEATARRHEWRAKLFARLPDLEIWRGLAPAATTDDLATLLDAPGKALLQFVVDEHDLLVILAAAPNDPDSVMTLTASVVPIERQDLAERIGRALDRTSLASVEAWRKGSGELFGLLPDDIRDGLAKAKSIIVVPDDVLWRVPIEAMPIESTYLADRAVVTYAPSVSSILRVPAPEPNDANAWVVAVHSPQLPPELLEKLKATAPTWLIRSGETTAAEVARIKDVVKPESNLNQDKNAGEPIVVLEAADATSARVKEIGAVVALHIAAPFRVNTASPLFSPILLTPVTDEALPAPARAEFEIRELFNVDRLPSTVMLSDPAALSKRDAAAAVAPVAWAWRAAGTTTLLLRRWGGDEERAGDVIGTFYEAVRAGKSAADALHEARARVRRTDGGSPPAAWAGWLVISGK